MQHRANKMVPHERKEPCSSGRSLVVFAASLASRLEGAMVRLPPNYVGVRRVRPSNHFVAQLQKNSTGTVIKPYLRGDDDSGAANVMYKVIDPKTGRERRMTACEKRCAKLIERQQKKQRNARIQHGATENAYHRNELDNIKKEEEQGSDSVKSRAEQSDPGLYVSLPVDPESLAEELADLRGERDGVPPVVLPPPLCQLLLPLGAGDSPQEIAVLDDEIALRWAFDLKVSMAAAEENRQAEEGLRKMPYQLVPEEWKRMRPSSMGLSSVKTHAVSDSVQLVQDSGSWAFCQIRPTTRTFDSDAACIAQVLHKGTHLQLSCGAKFGCDYLLYDGPRQERHAFAGLRILPTTQPEGHPLPTAYDLSGYVRCLNTAGKRALLATVVRDDQGLNRVAIVDLALVKVAETTSIRKRKTMEQQFQNLSKTL